MEEAATAEKLGPILTALQLVSYQSVNGPELFHPVNIFIWYCAGKIPSTETLSIYDLEF